MNGAAAVPTASTLGKRAASERGSQSPADAAGHAPSPGAGHATPTWDSSTPQLQTQHDADEAANGQRPYKKLRGQLPGSASPARGKEGNAGAGSSVGGPSSVSGSASRQSQDRDMLGPASESRSDDRYMDDENGIGGSKDARPSAYQSSSQGSARMDLVNSQHSPQHQQHHGAPSVPMPMPMPMATGRRPPSMFDVEPCDDVTRVVSLFLRPFIGQENIEIEAKLGILVDKQTKQRVYWGVDTEAVIQDSGGRTSFVSDMSEAQHQFFNSLFNARVQAQHPPVTYSHKRHNDESFDVPGAPEGKVRVTKEVGSNAVGFVVVGVDQLPRPTLANSNSPFSQKIVNCISKRRLAHLDIHVPESLVDYRISVNMEVPMPTPYGKYPSHVRQKDRISYQYDCFSLDLTQVMNLNAAVS